MTAYQIDNKGVISAFALRAGIFRSYYVLEQTWSDSRVPSKKRYSFGFLEQTAQSILVRIRRSLGQRRRRIHAMEVGPQAIRVCGLWGISSKHAAESQTQSADDRLQGRIASAEAKNCRDYKYPNGVPGKADHRRQCRTRSHLNAANLSGNHMGITARKLLESILLSHQTDKPVQD